MSNESVLTENWTLSETPAKKATKNGSVYWKKIVFNGRIIAKACGKSVDDATSIAMYICDIHNNHVNRAI